MNTCARVFTYLGVSILDYGRYEPIGRCHGNTDIDCMISGRKRLPQETVTEFETVTEAKNMMLILILNMRGTGTDSGCGRGVARLTVL